MFVRKLRHISPTDNFPCSKTANSIRLSTNLVFLLSAEEIFSRYSDNTHCTPVHLDFVTVQLYRRRITEYIRGNAAWLRFADGFKCIYRRWKTRSNRETVGKISNNRRREIRCRVSLRTSNNPERSAMIPSQKYYNRQCDAYVYRRGSYLARLPRLFALNF